MAKKKAKRKTARRTMTTHEAVKAILRPEPESTIALQLKLPFEYSLLGYYQMERTPGGDGAMPAYALVALYDIENPSRRYATYEVADPTGKCILDHYFGEYELHAAHEDFWRRTRVTDPPKKKGAARATTPREAWKEKALDMADRQQMQRTPAPASPSVKEKGK